MLNRLTLERRRRGWSQADLARVAGVNVTSISLAENGRYIPSARQLEKLRKALGIVPADAGRLLETVEYEPLAVAR